jgi:hypothetical protein
MGSWKTGPVDSVEEREVVLLVVEEAVEEYARSRRDREFHALMPVSDVPDADSVDGLRKALSWPGSLDVPEIVRYHRVCIVAFPSSAARTWVTAFFAAEAAWLVEAGRLWWCLPPFDRRHMTPMDVAEVLEMAGQWAQLAPAAPTVTSSTPKLHPSWLDRPGTGGFWSGPEVVVVAGEPGFHLRVQEGRRSFCGRPAKGLEPPEPPLELEEIARDRRCLECARLWWEDLRPQQEWERRDVLRRREATEGLLAAFNQLDAINRTIADAPDWPSAHAALTADPFGYTDLQAFHILAFPTGRRTAEGRSDLESQQADLHSWLARLDAFFADAPDHEATSPEPPSE